MRAMDSQSWSRNMRGESSAHFPAQTQIKVGRRCSKHSRSFIPKVGVDLRTDHHVVVKVNAPLGIPCIAGGYINHDNLLKIGKPLFRDDTYQWQQALVTAIRPLPSSYLTGANATPSLQFGQILLTGGKSESYNSQHHRNLQLIDDSLPKPVAVCVGIPIRSFESRTRP
jgi:hypothetical protein